MGAPSAHKATPAPARHLSFPHSPPNSHTQPFYSAGAAVRSPEASPHGSASPTLSLPTLRPPRAVPHSPQAAKSAHGSQGRAFPSSPEAVASPTLSLPSPRASRAAPSSPALEPQLRDSVQISSASVNDAAAAAALSTPEATRHEHQEESEVYALSEIWRVFEQVIKQVSFYCRGDVMH